MRTNLLGGKAALLFALGLLAWTLTACPDDETTGSGGSDAGPTDMTQSDGAVQNDATGGDTSGGGGDATGNDATGGDATGGDATGDSTVGDDAATDGGGADATGDGTIGDDAGNCDVDGDTYIDEACGGNDCDDTDPLVYPGADEICDGIDNDCDDETPIDDGLGMSGDMCEGGDTCCSGICANGECVNDIIACSATDAACEAPEDCCSGFCEPSPLDGALICIEAATCLAAGETCEVAGDCCSTGCIMSDTGLVCAADATCAAVGEDCELNTDCCGDNCGAGLTCEASGGCGLINELCEGDDDCCTMNCGDDDRCVRGEFCRPFFADCEDDDQCCSGLCLDNSCADTRGADNCLPFGQPCSGSNCCSVICGDPGLGYDVCLFPGGCRPAGEICRADAECCSFAFAGEGACLFPITETACDAENPCGDGFLCDEDAGFCRLEVGQCDRRGENDSCPEGERCNCSSPGEMCQVAAPNDCCNPDGIRTPSPGQWCEEIDFGDAKRCASDFSSQCRADGTDCLASEDCCSGLCLLELDEEGNPVGLRCGGQSCAELDQFCLETPDCCGAGEVEGRVCNTLNRCADGNVIACVPDGGECNDVNLCCSGPCVDVDGTDRCGGVTCADDGDICLVNEDCCNNGSDGISCNENLRCGVEPIDMCLPIGDVCTGDAECCTGSCGDDGFCAGEIACSPVLGSCDADLDCCDFDGTNPGVCDTAEGVCLGSCVDEGDNCTRNADCCAGFCGVDGTCQPPIIECIPAGTGCDPANSQCCRLLTCTDQFDPEFTCRAIGKD